MFNDLKKTSVSVMVLLVLVGVVITVMGFIPSSITSQIAKLKTMAGGVK